MSTVDSTARVRTRALVFLGFLGLWQLLSVLFPSYVFPGIVETLAATEDAILTPQIGTYVGFVVDTLRRLLIGFLISLGVGSILGSLMGLRSDAEAFLRSYVILGLSIPAIAVAFALIIIIGISELVPILTVTIIGIPFVMLNMWEGTQDLDPQVTEMADFFGASRYQRFRHVILPQLLQYIFPSMYWGLIVSWKVLFVAEVFGAGSGVGYMVNYWFSQQRVDMLLGWVIVPILLIILVQEGIREAEHRLMAWR